MRNMRKLVLGLLLVPCSLFSWTTPITVYTAERIRSPQVGLDSQGRAVIALTAINTNTPSYEIGVQVIANQVTNLHQYPHFDDGSERDNTISVNPQGNAVLGWTDSDSIPNFILNTAFLIDGNWSSVSQISGNDPPSFQSSKVYLDQFNVASAMWYAPDVPNSIDDFVVSRYTSSNWNINEVLENTGVFVFGKAFTGNPSGKLLVAWKSEANSNINADYFDGSSWSKNIISTNVGDSSVGAALNDSNNGYIAWNDSVDGITGVTFSNGSFGPETTIYTPLTDEHANRIKLTMNSSGNAVLVMELNGHDNSELIKVIRYENNSWGAPFTLETFLDGGENLNNWVSGMDDAGNIYVLISVFSADFTVGTLFIRKYDATTQTWGDRDEIPQNGLSFPSSQSMAVLGNGDVAITWTASDTINLVSYCLFTSNFGSILLPPQNFNGIQMKNVFLQQTLTLNRLFWTPTTDPAAIGYFIYRNDELVATILDKAVNTYDDNVLGPLGQVTYKICAFDANGLTSDLIQLVLGI